MDLALYKINIIIIIIILRLLFMFIPNSKNVVLYTRAACPSRLLSSTFPSTFPEVSAGPVTWYLLPDYLRRIDVEVLVERLAGHVIARKFDVTLYLFTARNLRQSLHTTQDG